MRGYSVIGNIFTGKIKTDLGDFWGGLAAMLVVLPSSIAFGVTIYSAIGPSYASLGAMAGIIGATVLGLVAPTLGGTDRLITTPCAPAAAVLSAFAITLNQQGVQADAIILLLILLGVITGLGQMMLGFVGIGRLIKFIPYPVVSGYMSGVGLIILGSQIPILLGAPGSHWWEILVAPALWDWRAVAVGGATIFFTFVGPQADEADTRHYHRYPGGSGDLLWSGGMVDPSLWQTEGNPLVVGPMNAQQDGIIAAISGHWRDIGDLRLGQVAGLFGMAATLAVLLSIDTLKTCVVVDQLTRSRHDSNRELVAQGVANICSSSVGGVPGAGAMGPTLVNLNSGGRTRVSGILEGVFALVAALLLGSLLAWIPVAALAGVLIVVGLRMIDREPLHFIQSRATVFDFVVVLAVVIVALTIGLIAASGTGVALAILLFVREQIGGAVVRHKVYVNQMSSTWNRTEAETDIIEKKGDQAVIFELQGSLFFGTSQQLYSQLEPEFGKRHFMILDLRRVQSMDVTAAHLLGIVRDGMAEKGALLILSGIPEMLPNGRNLREFLEQTAVIIPDETAIKVFPSLDNAIEWVEDRLLGERDVPLEVLEEEEPPLQLQEMEVFGNRKDETLQDLEARLEERIYKAGMSFSPLAPGGTVFTGSGGARCASSPRSVPGTPAILPRSGVATSLGACPSLMLVRAPTRPWR
jgi:SulP family sulfate permease